MHFSLLIALRIFRKHFVSKFLCTITLTIGVLFFLIAATIYVKDTNVNNKFTKSESIVKVETDLNFRSGEIQSLSVSPAAIAPHLSEVLGDVGNHARILSMNSVSIRANDLTFHEQDVVKVDPSFFELFDFNAIHGSIDPAISTRTDVAVLSEGEATKFFGSGDPIGKVIRINDEDHEVIAVVMDSDTDLDHAVFVPLEQDVYEFEWVETFLLLNSSSGEAEFENELNTALSPIMEGQYNSDVMSVTFDVTSLSEMRFNDKLFGTMKSNKSFLNLLLLIAFLLMALSCFSVLNLESTISIRRSKEIQLKKLFGASKKQLFVQYLLENAIIFLLSIPIALVVLNALLPQINTHWNYQLALNDFLHRDVIGALVLITGSFIGLMAFLNYLLHFASNDERYTDQSLKKPIFHGVKRLVLPVQIFICLLIVLFTGLASTQIAYVAKAPLRFEYKDVFVLDIVGELPERHSEIIKTVMLSKSYTKGASAINDRAVPGRDTEIQLFALNSSSSEEELVAEHLFVDEDFFDVLGISHSSHETFVEGAVFVNMQMKKKMDAVDPISQEQLNALEVIGTVSDYFHDGVFSRPKPAVFEFSADRFNTVLVKTAPDTHGEVVNNDIQAFIKKEKLEIDVKVSSLRDIYFARQKGDQTLLSIISFCSLFVIVITLIGILASTNMLYNLLARDILIKRLMGAGKYDVIIGSLRKISIESSIAITSAIVVAHVVFFQWQSKYVIKSEPTFENYFSLVLVIGAAIATFTILFYSRMRTLNLSDLSGSK